MCEETEESEEDPLINQNYYPKSNTSRITAWMLIISYQASWGARTSGAVKRRMQL